MTEIDARLQARIASLETLPTSTDVMLQCLALIKNPDAEVDDYVALIETDPALTSKVLALCNSS